MGPENLQDGFLRVNSDHGLLVLGHPRKGLPGTPARKVLKKDIQEARHFPIWDAKLRLGVISVYLDCWCLRIGVVFKEGAYVP